MENSRDEMFIQLIDQVKKYIKLKKHANHTFTTCCSLSHALFLDNTVPVDQTFRGKIQFGFFLLLS